LMPCGRFLMYAASTISCWCRLAAGGRSTNRTLSAAGHIGRAGLSENSRIQAAQGPR
jgi:hypothetical protein